MIFFDDDNGAYRNFLTLLAGATVNNLLAVGLFVLDTCKFEALQVYYNITAAQHAETTDGRIVNKMTIEIEEY